MTTTPAAAAGVPARSRARRWDLVASIVLLVLSALLGLLLLGLAPFLVMAGDPCGAALECDTDQMGVGFLLALIGPAVATAAGIVATIALLAFGRLAFWVPIAASTLAVGIFLLGAAIVVGGVPGATL